MSLGMQGLGKGTKEGLETQIGGLSDGGAGAKSA